MQMIIIVLICFILPMVILIKPVRESIVCKKSFIEFVREYKWELFVIFALIIGSLVRMIAIGQFPNALNVDEASSGYDAFAIMKHGIDRGGNSYPVYLYSWGSGQSALYSYLMIPVLAITGLTEYGIRLPMAIAGVISLYVFYYLIKNIFNDKKIAFVGLCFFSICPWHIMKSRWGMECNLFPDLVMIAVLLLVLGIKKKKIILQVLSFIILAISSYAYSTSYLFLPVFVLGVLGYLIYKKEITWKKALAYLITVIVICVPIILYVVINVFDLNQIKILGLTIPKMALNRYSDTTTVFSGNIFENCVNNLLDTLKLLILQNDGLEWNAIHGYGMFYLVSIVFFVIGVMASVKKYRKNDFNEIMNIWMIATIVLSAFCVININRINIIMIPCIYYISVGIYEIFARYKTMIPCIAIIYAYLFVTFSIDYYHQDYNNYFTFTSGVKEVADYCERTDCEKIYCYYSFKEPFIYFMFYTEADVHEYLNTVQYFNENGTFDNIKSFGKYNFYLPENVEENSVIIVPKGSILNYDVQEKEKVSINQLDIYKF